MKRKMIEKLVPKAPGEEWGDYMATVQTADEILILNIWKDGTFKGKYCMNTETYEYECFFAESGEWKKTMIYALLDMPAWMCGSYYDLKRELSVNSEAEEKKIVRLLRDGNRNRVTGPKEWAWWITHRERKRSTEIREKAEASRTMRLALMMAKIPKLPNHIDGWIYRAAADREYMFKNREKGTLTCTGCDKDFNDGELKREDGEKKVRHNDTLICPKCGKKVTAKTRTDRMEMKTHFLLLQPMDEGMSVARYFDVKIEWNGGGHRTALSEGIRFILHKGNAKKKHMAEIYYNQDPKEWHSLITLPEGRTELSSDIDYFDRNNPRQRDTGECFLYFGHIKEALKDTAFENWAGCFRQLAGTGRKLDYIRMLIMGHDTDFIGMTEYLFKGRFNRLLRETVNSILCWGGRYIGELNPEGKTIEEVFGIKDRQLINRLREADGGEHTLQWLKWSYESGKKIPQETLEWLTGNDITTGDIRFIQKAMSPTQIMNYVVRQQQESYHGRTAKEVISQWHDYDTMCRRLNKDTEDQMVYRPRELKRRHDEAVEEINRQRMLEELKRNRQQENESKEQAERYGNGITAG